MEVDPLPGLWVDEAFEEIDERAQEPVVVDDVG